MTHEEKLYPIKYYGLHDYGIFSQIQSAMDYLSAYDDNKMDYTLTEIVELFNALQFVEHNVFPEDYDDKQRAIYKALKPKIKKSVALFFKKIDESNAKSIITEISYIFRKDLLSLLVMHKVHHRVSAATLLAALVDSGIDIGTILENKFFVTTYDTDIRLLILAEPKNAEQIICKHLETRAHDEVYLPQSLTPSDTHTLIEKYLDRKEANPNYIKLIADSRISKTVGIDAKLKLKAKRIYDAWIEELFKNSHGTLMTSCDICLSNEQEEPIKLTMDGKIVKCSYSRKWLEEHSTPAEIVAIFIKVFAFAREGMILSLPAYSSELAIVERFMVIKGKESYPAGAAFQFRERCAFCQTMMYEKFLCNREQQLEDVIAWFFNDYIEERFSAEGFNYKPSSKTSTYLEKSRHIFTEMESVIKQFSLYVENGEIDKDLLSITSDQIRYINIPSQVAGKYAYPTDHGEITSVLRDLFSDQSGLTYINNTLQSDSLFNLILSTEIPYDAFHDHQKPQIDRLLGLAVLEKIESSIKFRSNSQIVALKTLFDVEALNYHCYPESIQSEIDDMVHAGWLVKKSTPHMTLRFDPRAV